MKFKSAYYRFLIFAFCTIAYQLVIDTIRPQYIGNNSTIKYLLGVAPNFFPATGIPALLVLIIPYVLQKNNSGTWFYKKRHFSANLISVIGLVGWEFLQLSGRLRFDWNDILWTLIGATVFHFIWLISPQKYKAL
jgi:hypothetical protein